MYSCDIFRAINHELRTSDCITMATKRIFMRVKNSFMYTVLYFNYIV